MDLFRTNKRTTTSHEIANASNNEKGRKSFSTPRRKLRTVASVNAEIASERLATGVERRESSGFLKLLFRTAPKLYRTAPTAQLQSITTQENSTDTATTTVIRTVAAISPPSPPPATTTTTSNPSQPSDPITPAKSVPPSFIHKPYTPSEGKPSISRPRSRQNLADSSCLYLAYEKTIKASSLTVPALSAENVLKQSEENKAIKENRKKGFRKPSHPGGSEYPWIRKLFLLVPGCICQYNANGAYDREPEKVLKLRPESLTFATDVLEGKHWVLQVNSYRDGFSAPPDERRPSLFERFSDARRNEAAIMLLVFDSAEEMQEWIIKLRAEICRLGGKVVEEHPKPRSKPQLEEHVVEFSSDYCPSENTSRRISRASRPSEDLAPSMSTILSQDQLLLDDLRSNSNMSLPFRTGDIFSGTRETSPNRSTDFGRSRSNTIESLSTPSASIVDLRHPRSRPHSTTINPGSELSFSDQPPSPRLCPISTPFTADKRLSIGASSPPIPIPTTSIPLGSYSALPPHFDTQRRRKASRKRTSPPLSPEPPFLFTPLSVSLPNHATPTLISFPKRRPASMANPPVISRIGSSDSLQTMSQLARRPTVTSSRPRNLKRRSLGALGTPIGPPMHPPPSAPLPKLPGELGEASSGSIPPVPPIPVLFEQS